MFYEGKLYMNISRHNVRIKCLKTENIHHVRCGLPKDQLIRVFAERYINNWNVYLDMMESYFFQLEEKDNLNSLYFQLDGAPPQ